MREEREQQSELEEDEEPVYSMVDFLNKYEETRFAKEFNISEVVWRTCELANEFAETFERNRLTVFTQEGTFYTILSL